MECPNKLTRSGEELEELSTLIKRNKSDDVNSLVFYNQVGSYITGMYIIWFFQDGRPNSMLTVEPLGNSESLIYNNSRT